MSIQSKRVRGVIGIHAAVVLMLLRLSNETEEHTPDDNSKQSVSVQCARKACANNPPVVLTGMTLDI